MPEREQLPGENRELDPAAYDSFGKEGKLATVSWYLVTIGIALLVLAALCLYLGRTGHTDFFKHKDFALNPAALSRYLLLAGLFAYAAGRAITYYRRFRKRESG
ncbi:MAG TPA: hypothetical protein VJ385_17855 [Fibrobacteria bacterium]|nr:hypothetical protein [Fibrobacteria bacterium]